MDYKANKSYRLIYMNEKLSHGELLRKDTLVAEFDVSPKTIQRDIDTLRFYLIERGIGDLLYNRRNDCYQLEKIDSGAEWLTAEEVFAICKILIESRAFNKEEFEELTRKLLLQIPPEQRPPVEMRIGNERVNYIPLRHGRPLIEKLWKLANLVTEQRIIRIWYVRQDKTPRSHLVKPVGIMFSEFYFYLIAWLADDSKDFYTVFRIDRITDIEVGDERFHIPYAQRFNESEFRKRVQFMYPGQLKKVRFVYRGSSIEAVLDRLPTAEVIKKNDDGSSLLVAESFGDGIYMWLNSQGNWVEIID